MTDPHPSTDVTFADLGLRTTLLDALAELGYEEPTPIQTEAIPVLLQGRDLLGGAATGTGKTAAFALPLLERLPSAGGPIRTVALVLVPTRELAIQVAEAVYRYGRHLGAQVLPVYGGQPIGRQLAALNRGMHVVVATPGRALDHLERGSLPLDDVEVVVLDEADEMLDMGFADEIEAILAATPSDRQTVLFSATLPPRIASIADRHLRDPVRIQIDATPGDGDGDALVEERAYVVHRAHKAAALGRVLDVEAPTAAIVFCRTRTEVDELTETLNARGYRAEALHGGMDQVQRDRVMGRLRAGTVELVVATDVAARGLDIDQLTHVVNYDVPSSPESYVHRIGRVGRAGRDGIALTLAEPRELRMLENIERRTRRRIARAKVPTVADLRARQIDATVAAVQVRLEDDDELERFRSVLDRLAEEHDLDAVALAAVALVHEASGATDDDVEIPEVAERPRRADRGERRDRPTGLRRAPADGGTMASLYVGVGRGAGVRPGDLVGAIAGETRLSGRDIGAIRITERFSLVEVPADAADEVIAALGRTTIRGRKASVRRDRDRS
ncbi:DEAD/DEAH box helicase [Actinomarinicola tropica]|uniref:RNA helicase n=1 Tax=Actinomarinicola tropica TaxID=2789776 RepID=A0A5Q2RMU3_9ACTN|nr:DEAD/DEAH box helicase [Actinomarinicola tropica]QGG95397.1 DEAD/DEAH box helicase [Actinomarinicola tropica]